MTSILVHASIFENDVNLDKYVRDLKSKNYSIEKTIKKINDFVNSTVKYVPEDPQLPEIWQSPWETLRLQSGDCEDYAILKYYILREIFRDYENFDLRIIYVFIKKNNEQIPHMMTAVKFQSHDDYFLLDNVTDEIKLSAERKDVGIVFSINEEHNLYQLTNLVLNGDQLVEKLKFTIRKP